jgi:hypothetical protein
MLMENSTSETHDIARLRIMALTGEERFILGCRMFVEYRAEIIASLPKVLSPIEFKRQLFQRIYGYPLPPDFQASASSASPCSATRMM